METTLARMAPPIRRLAYGTLSLALLGLIAYVLAGNEGGWWQLGAFGLGPDLALLVGVGSGLARGQLRPRSVPFYNELHRFWGPLALLLTAFAADLSAGWAIGALAWALHIAIDRTVGYGLRTPDGFQRS